MVSPGIRDWPGFCRHHGTAPLSPLDRTDLQSCKNYVLALGYEALTVHAVDPLDGVAASELACTCRVGETWMTWVFARIDDRILAWSALTGADAGSFTSMSEAIRCVLLCDPAKDSPISAGS
jgi:hypothetical protein